MDLGLSGTRVLVAGASQGIGRGIAEALLATGLRLLAAIPALIFSLLLLTIFSTFAQTIVPNSL